MAGWVLRVSATGTTGTATEGFGWVEELRGRYVVVRDRDGVETLVPNQNLITNPVNLGFGGANNVGLAQVQTPMLLSLAHL